MGYILVLEVGRFLKVLWLIGISDPNWSVLSIYVVKCRVMIAAVIKAVHTHVSSVSSRLCFHLGNLCHSKDAE